MSEIINRAFMYGESVFTTMRMINGHLCDWDYHFDRLKQGIHFVFGPFNAEEEWVLHLKNRLEDRCAVENGDRVLRLTVYREQARGLVSTGLISVGDLKIALSSNPYDPEQMEGKALKLRTCAAPLRPHWWPEYLKAGNYLETILSQKRCLQPGDDDVLFLSPSDTVLETSIANIFVVHHNRLYTPPVGPNVLAGVMRRKVIEGAPYIFENCTESASTLDQLYRSEAVFGTNSVRGPFLIDRIDDRDFNYTQEFLEKFESLRRRVMT